MPTRKKTRFGELPPSFNFVLNPYPGERLSRCPFCEQKTGQRKRPLLIHIDPQQLLALNYTCRYCPTCDLLIAHKHEIEHLLTELFKQTAPESIGNYYLIFGTVERKTWRENMKQPLPFSEIVAHTSDFINHYQELRMRQQGWFPKDYEPPILEPPPSKEWIRPL